MKKYKPSMFNRIVMGEELILYNSYYGSKSVVIIQEKFKKKVLDYLCSKEVAVSGEAEDEYLFSKLLDRGFLVDRERDEIALREKLYYDICTDGRLRLVIHTTKQCNFRCQYCSLDFSNKPMEKEMQDAIVKFVEHNISQFTGIEVSWFGGEPLLEMEAINYLSERLIKICARHHKPYIAIVTTNGFLLKPEIVQQLIKNKVVHIAVTIDGLENRHNKQRYLVNGAPTFDTIIENLLWIKKHIGTKCLTVTIRSNITIQAYNEVLDFYRYFNDLFGDNENFSLFIRPVRDWGGSSVKKLEGELFENRADFQISEVYDLILSNMLSMQFYGNYSDIDVGGLSCSAKYKNKYTIGADGIVSKCDDSSDVEKIGYLSLDGKMHLDESANAKWLKRYINSEKCNTCFLSCVCLFEVCPKGRLNKLPEQAGCCVNMDEIDKLIEWISKVYPVEII